LSDIHSDDRQLAERRWGLAPSDFEPVEEKGGEKKQGAGEEQQERSTVSVEAPPAI
jgi:hypothetical protein